MSNGVDSFDLEARKLAGLSATERDIARLACEGMTDRQIGERLSMSPGSVGRDLGEVFRKLGISNRLELIVLCYRHRLVQSEVGSE